MMAFDGDHLAGDLADDRGHSQSRADFGTFIVLSADAGGIDGQGDDIELADGLADRSATARVLA